MTTTSLGVLLLLTLTTALAPSSASAAADRTITLSNGVTCTYTWPHLNRSDWAAIVCGRMAFNMQMWVDCADAGGVYRLTVGPGVFSPEPYGRGFFCSRGATNVVVDGGVLVT